MESLVEYLQGKTLKEITSFINEYSPEKQISALKCKKDQAISQAVGVAIQCRSKRHKRQYSKLSRKLRKYFRSEGV